MRVWKSAALTSASLLVITAAVVTTAVHGQSRERTAVAKAFEFIGRGPQIGVTVRDVQTDAATPASAGVIVDDVETGTPAEKAGVKPGDAIVEFDGERVRSVRQFRRLVRETPPGRKVPAVLSRNGQRITITLAPERGSGLLSGDDFDMERWEDSVRGWSFPTPPPPPSPAAPAPPRPPRAPSVEIPEMPEFDFNIFGRGGRFGVSVENLTPQLEGFFGVKEGVLVTSVTDGSAAAKAGVKAGDIITAVSGSHVNDRSDVSRAINRLEGGDEFSIEIVRDKKPQTLKGRMEPRQDRVRSRTVV
jgi:serine protease Do